MKQWIGRTVHAIWRGNCIDVAFGEQMLLDELNNSNQSINSRLALRNNPTYHCIMHGLHELLRGTEGG